MALRVDVSVPRGQPSRGTLRVYGNWGSSLSSEKRISVGAVRAYAPGEAPPDRGHLRAGHLSDKHLGVAPSPGHLMGRHLNRHLDDVVLRQVHLRDLYGYGPFTLAVEPADDLSQVEASAPATQTVFLIEAPLELGLATFNSYDAGDDQVAIDVTHGSMN